MNPKPAIPEEIIELKGQATAAFKQAKTPAEYGDAVDAYRKALLLAPWAGDMYFNLGVAQQKAEKPLDAIQSFKLYLLATPDTPDREAILERIGGLKYTANKTRYDWLIGRWKSTGQAIRLNGDKYPPYYSTIEFSRTGNIIEGGRPSTLWKLRAVISDAGITWQSSGRIASCGGEQDWQPASVTVSEDQRRLVYTGTSLNCPDYAVYATKTEIMVKE